MKRGRRLSQAEETASAKAWDGTFPSVLKNQSRPSGLESSEQVEEWSEMRSESTEKAWLLRALWIIRKILAWGAWVA